VALIAEENEVDQYLNKILTSRSFTNCPQLQKLLGHIVTLSRDGRAAELKEFAVGVDVFGRRDGYDPKLDAIVRVHARRLRERLDLYYIEEGADDPVRIEVPRGAYVANVRERRHINPPPAPKATPTWRRWRLLIFVAAMLVLLPLVALIQPGRPLRAGASSLVFEPLTTLPGQEDQPSWSPDGLSVLFTWTGSADGVPAVYTKKPGDPNPIRLTNSGRAEYRPRWSPDGARVAFFRRSGITDYEVVLLDRVTAHESVLGTVTSGLFSGYVPGMDWAPDGESLALTEQDTPVVPMRVVLWSLRDGRHTPLTNPPADTSGDLDVKFSPDGKRLAVLRNAKVDLLVVSIAGGSKEQLVMSSDRAFRGVDWLDDTTLVAARLGDDETGGLWKIPLGAGTPVRLTPRLMAAESPAFHAGSGQLAFVDAGSDIDIWRYTTATGKGQPAIASTRFDGAPSLSPDERRLAFLSSRSGSLEVWLAAVDGSGERCLTSLNGAGHILTPPAWSPDGRLLAIQIRMNRNSDIYLLPTAGGALRRLTSDGSHEYFPSFSQDGRFVYFSSARTGRMELFRTPVTGGPAVRVTTGSALIGWEFDRGRSLLFARVDRSAEFWRQDLSSNQTTLLFEEARGPMPVLTCALANESVFFLRQSSSESKPAELYKHDLETGTTKRMASFDSVSTSGLAGMAGAGAKAVTSDGRFAYLPHATARRSDLVRIKLNRP
jgi:Tol biopolymer transport system component